MELIVTISNRQLCHHSCHYHPVTQILRLVLFISFDRGEVTPKGLQTNLTKEVTTLSTVMSFCVMM